MTWYDAVDCTQVEPDTLMVCCAAPWFSSIFSGVGHFRPTASVPVMLGMERHFIGRQIRDRHHGARQFEIWRCLPPQRPRRHCQTNFSGRLWLWWLQATSNPFRYFNSSPEIIGLAVLMYVKYPLSLRNVEDLLAEPAIDISRETVRWRVAQMPGDPQWRWDLDEAFVKVNSVCRDPYAGPSVSGTAAGLIGR